MFVHMSASPFVGKSWSFFNACRPRLRFANAWSKCLHSTQQDMTNLALLLHHGQKTLLSQMMCLTHWILYSSKTGWQSPSAKPHTILRCVPRTGGMPLKLCSYLLDYMYTYIYTHACVWHFRYAWAMPTHCKWGPCAESTWFKEVANPLAVCSGSRLTFWGVKILDQD
jgi:hypothetical protein